MVSNGSLSRTEFVSLGYLPPRRPQRPLFIIFHALRHPETVSFCPEPRLLSSMSGVSG